MVTKCPICGSIKLRKPNPNSKEMRCDKCGYTHSERRIGKVVIRTSENWNLSTIK